MSRVCLALPVPLRSIPGNLQMTFPWNLETLESVLHLCPMEKAEGKRQEEGQEEKSKRYFTSSLEATVKNLNMTFTHRRKQWGYLLRRKTFAWPEGTVLKGLLRNTDSASYDWATQRCWVSWVPSVSWVHLPGSRQPWSPSLSSVPSCTLSSRFSLFQTFHFPAVFNKNAHFWSYFSYQPLESSGIISL